MQTEPIPVHGLSSPPDGCEWHLKAIAGQSAHIVARRKWSPADLKPGDKCITRDGRCRQFLGDLRPLGYDGGYPLIFGSVDGISSHIENGNACDGLTEEGDIIGPWIEPEPESHHIAECTDAKVFDRELTAAEVAALHAKESAEPEAKQEAWKDGILEACSKQFNSTPRHSVEPEQPAIDPAWTPPEWAKKGLKWMTHGSDDFVSFFLTEPKHAISTQWSCDIPKQYVGALSVSLAKALNLYPPHWSDLPASERCVNLGGGE